MTGLKAVRRQAGKARDMDVLTSDIVGLGLEDDPNCLVGLVHRLGDQRNRHARKLHSIVQARSSELRQRLKQSRRRLQLTVERFAKNKFDLDSNKTDEAAEPPLHAMSVALRLCKELAAVPRLGANNLHSYRIEVKRLRYLLEMADVQLGQQQAFIEELKKVQDAIGEWHDWVELSAIAHDVLAQHRGCKLVAKIGEIRDRKFKNAMAVTEKMRGRYLPLAKQGRKSPGAGRRRRLSIPGPVLVATSEIAA
jgi:CHAD domain-containing protein